MISAKLIDNLNDQLTQLFGEGPQKTQEEFKRGANMILQSAFTKMDLVTREEFDTQKAVLMRTRELVDQLEKRILELEQASSNQTPSNE